MAGRAKMTGTKQKQWGAELFPDAGQGRDWAVLERIYKKSARTLKRYDQTGREVGDLCPLENPSAMPSWWQTHMKHQIPQVLLDAARSAKLPPRQQAVEDPPAGDAEIPEEITAGEMGLERTLERLAKMEVKLHRSASDPGQTKPWLDTISRMSTVAEKLRVEAVRLGKLIPRDQVEEAIHSFHGPVEREIRLLYKTMCDALGLPPSPEKEARWNEEIDVVFRRFHEEVLR